jgi:hypothetical protein
MAWADDASPAAHPTAGVRRYGSRAPNPNPRPQRSLGNVRSSMGDPKGAEGRAGRGRDAVGRRRG